MKRNHTISRLLSATLLTLAACACASAEAPVKISVRAAVNTSNISGTRMFNNVSGLQTNDWKTGFALGAVVDIRMTRRFYMQPGFYYDYNRCAYKTSISYPGVETGDVPVDIARHTDGTMTTSWFQIPVLASYRLNLKFVELQADFGPYIALGLGGSDDETVTTFSGDIPAETSPTIKTEAFGRGDDDRLENIDWGFKMGVGFLFARHYYVGAHYQIGARNIARAKEFLSKSHRYAWEFSIGYNF